MIYLGYDVHKLVSEECFTDEEKEVLEFKQGKRIITIEKILNRKYGKRAIRFKTKDDYLDAFTLILEPNLYRIDEIKELKEKIKIIKTPSSHYDSNLNTIVGKNKSIGTNRNTTVSENKNKSISFNVNKSQSESDARNISRNATTETSLLHEKVEEWDSKTKLHLETSLKSSNLEISGNLSTGIKTLEQDIEQADNSSIEGKTIPYNQINYSSNHSGDLSINNSNNKSSNESENINDSTSDTISDNTTDTSTNSFTSSYIEADAHLKALQTQIPDKRNKFFNLFDKLYKPC